MQRLVILIIVIGKIFFSSAFAQNSNMILVEGGSYKMGNFTGLAKTNERPIHDVMLNSFYVCKYQVTVGEFRDFINETGYITDCEKKKGGMIWLAEKGKEKYYYDSTASWKNIGYTPKDNQPVTYVSWYDAISYCNWKSIKDKLTPCYKVNSNSIIWDKSANGYRLLTEAEWEFVARSRGKNYKFSWGNDSLPIINGKKVANIKDQTCQKALDVDIKAWRGYEDGFVYSSPVGSFAPNELGVYDICGNVYEWCWDWLDDNYYSISPVENPDGPSNGKKRVCRNLGYSCPVHCVGTTHRGAAEPNSYGDNMGCRVGATKK